MISGDYCAWHETDVRVCYDITYNHPVGYYDYTLENLENWDRDRHQYSDVDIFEALKIGKKYYVLLR